MSTSWAPCLRTRAASSRLEAERVSYPSYLCKVFILGVLAGDLRGPRTGWHGVGEGRSCQLSCLPFYGMREILAGCGDSFGEAIMRSSMPSDVERRARASAKTTAGPDDKT